MHSSEESPCTIETLYSQYRNKEKNAEETEDLFFYRRIFVKSVSLEPYLTVVEKWKHYDFGASFNSRSDKRPMADAHLKSEKYGM